MDGLSTGWIEFQQDELSLYMMDGLSIAQVDSPPYIIDTY